MKRLISNGTLLGRGLKVVIGTCAMVDEMCTNKLKEELKIINNSLKGTKTIESANVLTDLPSLNSKDVLFRCMKELYNFSKKVLDLHRTSEAASNPEDIEGMIKRQLTTLLPGLLQTALEDSKTFNKADPDLAVKNVDAKPSVVHTMEVEIPKDNSQPEGAWKTMLRGPCTSLPVNKAVYDPVKGVAKLHFENRDSMDRAHDALKDSSLTATVNSTERKKILPKLTIPNLDPHIDSATVLEEELLNKNSFLKELKEEGKAGLRIVFVDKKTKIGDRYAVIEVSPETREAIRRNGDKLCIDFERCHVFDRYHVIQCYHCQEYGHIADSQYCKRKDATATCFYCAGEHKSKDCSERKLKTEKIRCSNCAKSKNRDEKRLCGSHKAGDYSCPCYIREKAHIMTRTAGCSLQTKNSYLQKAREIQRRKFGKVF